MFAMFSIQCVHFVINIKSCAYLAINYGIGKILNNLMMLLCLNKISQPFTECLQSLSTSLADKLYSTSCCIEVTTTAIVTSKAHFMIDMTDR